MLNYARHIATGAVVFFQDGFFSPAAPHEWALYRPIARLHSAHRIGEDPDVYLLRQLEISVASTEAEKLRLRWTILGLDQEDRRRVREMAAKYLEVNHVN